LRDLFKPPGPAIYLSESGVAKGPALPALLTQPFLIDQKMFNQKRCFSDQS
jgi:hypothetical protein